MPAGERIPNDESYRTVRTPVTAEQTIDKSRFIAWARPVFSPQDLERQMQEAQEAYPKARHYAYAYRLREGRQEKASDDGEPQGTGGRPVLDILQHYGLWNVHLIVIRYFGGVLLGTGGLTRAYGGTARLALEKAEIVALAEHTLWRLRLGYSWYDSVKYGCQQKGWRIEEEMFEEDVKLTVAVLKTEGARFEQWLAELAAGQIRCTPQEDVWRNLG